jgi:hypothetical protein
MYTFSLLLPLSNSFLFHLLLFPLVPFSLTYLPNSYLACFQFPT